MNWNELYTGGINVENIVYASEEYGTMFSAAVLGEASAQYCLGLWMEKVKEKLDTALIWYQKAAQQNVDEAIEAVQRLELRQSNAPKSTATKNNVTTLVIKEHNFKVAKNALKKYNEQAKKKIELNPVPTSGGIFNLGNHKVTGTELNAITLQIQNALINLQNLGQNIIDEFGEVYKAFESLDKDYMSGIVASIKAAEAVSIEEQKDRKDIKELIDQHDMAVDILIDFKEDTEAWKQLVDIDKVWESIANQTKMSEFFSKYIEGLSKIEHLKDVDEMWNITERVQDDIRSINNSLNSQEKKVSIWFQEWNEQIKKFIVEQEIKLNDIEEHYAQITEKILVEQKDKMASIEIGLDKKLERIAQEERSAINELKTKQDKELDEISKYQSLTLEQISESQSKKLKNINNALEEEKNKLNEQVDELRKEVKRMYIVAGGATAFVIIQFILNALGVF